MGLLALSRINEVCAGTRKKKSDQSGKSTKDQRKKKGGSLREAAAGPSTRRLSDRKDKLSSYAFIFFPRASALQKESLCEIFHSGNRVLQSKNLHSTFF